MGTQRLEAFSDGVIAIIITIMVLELRVPHDTTPQALRPLLPVFLSYVLLQRAIIARQGAGSVLARARDRGEKGRRQVTVSCLLPPATCLPASF